MTQITEEHLHLALQTLLVFQDEQEKPEHIKMIEESYKAVTLYIIDEIFNSDKDSFTEDDINDRISELLTETLLNNMISDGLIEASLNEDGEEVFELTELGKKHNDQLKEANK